MGAAVSSPPHLRPGPDASYGQAMDEAGAANPGLAGAIIAGRWRVGTPLGEGGVGAVYRAEHVGTERTVAIKVLHERFAEQLEFRRRFEREARAASKLSHP